MNTRKENIEKCLVRLLQDTLQTSLLTMNKSFYWHGGDSLKSMQLLSKLEQDLQIKVSFKEFFSCKDLNKLIELVHNKNLTNKNRLNR